jgi:hypothetical protein
MYRESRAENARLVELWDNQKDTICCGPECPLHTTAAVALEKLEDAGFKNTAQAEALAAKDAEIAGLEAELAREREENRDIPTIAYMSGAADWKRKAEAAEARVKVLEGGLNHIMQQGSLPGTIQGEWLLSNIARETLYPTQKEAALRGEEAPHD